MKILTNLYLRILGWISIQFFLFISLLYVERVERLFSNLLFEQLIMAATLPTIIVGLALFKLAKKLALGSLHIDRYHQLLILMVSALLIFQVAQTTVLNIDRSRSYYLLSWVDKGLVNLSGNTYDLSKVSSTEKMDSLGVKQRLTEQLSRRLIVIRDERVRLTFSGSLIVRVSNLLAHVFRLDGWHKNNH